MVREKTVEWEERQRRNNICITGVPGEEKAKLIQSLRFKTIKQENFPEIEKDLNQPMGN